MKRVNFFIVGVQKGGTTALDSFLRAHPSIQMAARKEIHFFDDDKIDWTRPDCDRLHSQFDWRVSDVIRGEATPIYIYWPNALDRLRAYHPAAKLIVLLRHPSFRAWSHWRMESTRSRETLPFSAAIREGRRRIIEVSPSGAHRIYSYVERGFYAEQVERLLATFRRANIFFARTDYLWTDPVATLGALEIFLGVGTGLRPDPVYISPITPSPAAAITAADRAYLDDIFAADIERTAQLTGLHLTDWLDPNYSEPMIPNS